MAKKNNNKGDDQNKDVEVAIGKVFGDLAKPKHLVAADLIAGTISRTIGEKVFRAGLPKLVEKLEEMGFSGNGLAEKSASVIRKIGAYEVFTNFLAEWLSEAAKAGDVSGNFAVALAAKLGLKIAAEGVASLDTAKAHPVKDVNHLPTLVPPTVDAKAKAVKERDAFMGLFATSIKLSGRHALKLNDDGTPFVDDKKEVVLLCETGRILQATDKDFAKSLVLWDAKDADLIGGSGVCAHCEPIVAGRIVEAAKKAAEAKPGEEPKKAEGAKGIDPNVAILIVAYPATVKTLKDRQKDGEKKALFFRSLLERIEGDGYINDIEKIPGVVAELLVSEDNFRDDGTLTDLGFIKVTGVIQALGGKQELGNKAGLGLIGVAAMVEEYLAALKDDEEPAAAVEAKPDLSGALATALEAHNEQDPWKRAHAFLDVAMQQAKAGLNPAEAFSKAAEASAAIADDEEAVFMDITIGEAQAKAGVEPSLVFDRAFQNIAVLNPAVQMEYYEWLGDAMKNAWSTRASAAVPPSPPPPPPKKGRARRFIEAMPAVLWVYAALLAGAVLVTVLGAMGGGFVGAVFSLLAAGVATGLTGPVLTLAQETLDRVDQGLKYKDDTPGSITKLKNTIQLGLLVLGIGTVYAAWLGWVNETATFPFGMRFAFTLVVMGLYWIHEVQLSGAEQVLRKLKGPDDKLNEVDEKQKKIKLRSAMIFYYLIHTVVISALLLTLWQSSTRFQDVLRGFWYGVQVNAAFLVAAGLLVVIAAVATVACYRFKEHKAVWIPVASVSVVLTLTIVGAFFMRGSEMKVTTPDGKTVTVPSFGGNTAPDFSAFAPISEDGYEAQRKIRDDVRTVVTTAADGLTEQAVAEIGSMKAVADRKREVEGLRSSVETDEEKLKLTRRKGIGERLLAIPGEIVTAEAAMAGLKEMQSKEGISISEREEHAKDAAAEQTKVAELKAEEKALKSELAELKGEKKTVADNGGSGKGKGGGNGSNRNASNDKPKPKQSDGCARYKGVDEEYLPSRCKGKV